MSKAKIIFQSSETYIQREKEILSQLKSDFIINIVCSFQDFSNLYLVLRLMSGGDLRYHLNYYKKPFTEEMIKFLIINISLSLDFIHQNNIIHRDIKPENFVFDQEGYLHLTDFGLAIYKDENSFNNMDMDYNNYDEKENENRNEKFIDNEIVGTLGYIAPEIILGMDKYTKAIDFYALGVICYELIFGQKPFSSLTRYEIGKEMLEDKVNYSINIDYPTNLINFVKHLLKINPKDRIGSIRGINDIKEKELFQGINWDSIQYKEYDSPFADIIQSFRINNKYDGIYEIFEVEKCRKSIKIDEETKLKLSEIEASPNYIHCFQDYSFIYFENDDTNDINSLSNYNSKRKTSRAEKVEYEYNFCNCHDLVLPPINQKLLKNVYKYKIDRYNGLLNKLKQKDDDKKHKTSKKENRDKDEKKEKKHRRHRRHSYDSYNGKPLIINNFCRQNPINAYGYNYNPYYPNPFLSVQNNFILPKINNFKRDNKSKIFKDNNTFSRYSSSETYERLKLKLKEKSKESHQKSKTKFSENIKKNKNNNEINIEDDNKPNSIKEKSEKNKDKNGKKSLDKKQDKDKKDGRNEEKSKDKKSSKSKGNKRNKNNKEKEDKEKGEEDKKIKNSGKSSL